MHITLNSSQHDLALHRGLVFLHELFQMADRRLHHFSALQHFRNNQFIVIEQSADFRHSSHQRTVNDLEWAGLG
ncbi:hypothetical protein D3C75_950320 [compost metagenome]